jgi:hypothetical protein
MNPLDTVTGTIVTGVVLAVILIYVAKAIAGV